MKYCVRKYQESIDECKALKDHYSEVVNDASRELREAIAATGGKVDLRDPDGLIPTLDTKANNLRALHSEVWYICADIACEQKKNREKDEKQMTDKVKDECQKKHHGFTRQLEELDGADESLLPSD